MNYSKLYNSIIKNARCRSILSENYNEKHHIIPKSLGGDDSNDNIVILTAKEHFICHLLLTKIYKEDTPAWYKMIKAFMFMKSNSPTHLRYTSIMYSYYRKRFAKAQSYTQRGEKNSSYGTIWIYNIDLEKSKKIKSYEIIPDGWQRGRVINFETGPRHQENRKENEEFKKKYGEIEFRKRIKTRIGLQLKGRKTGPMSEEIKQKISDAWKQKPKLGKGSRPLRGPMPKGTRDKISKRMFGANNPMSGKKHTKETLEKMSKALTGRTHSEETKQKIRKSMLARKG